jgi:hypothetical protein
MELAAAVERRLHARNPAVVHRRYVPGKCPWCSWEVNLRAMVISKARSSQPRNRPNMSA